MYINVKSGPLPRHERGITFARATLSTNLRLKSSAVGSILVRYTAETWPRTRFLFHPSNNSLTALVGRFKMMKSRPSSVECGTLRLMVIVIKRSAAVMGRERF